MYIHLHIYIYIHVHIYIYTHANPYMITDLFFCVAFMVQKQCLRDAFIPDTMLLSHGEFIMDHCSPG